MARRGCLLLAVGLALWLGLPALGTAGQYVNGKYRYSLVYPDGVFAPQGEADAGDGQRFLAAGGRASLTVYASFNVLEQTLDQAYAEALARPDRTIVYRRRHGNWFVVSGREGDAVYYRKTALANETFYTLELRYPQALKATFDPLVGGLVQGFTWY